jgi:hypothetical protein
MDNLPTFQVGLPMFQLTLTVKIADTKYANSRHVCVYPNRRPGLLFEAKVGKGKLMVCGASLDSDLDKRPAARQFRRSLEQYMSSDKFNPSQEL